MAQSDGRLRVALISLGCAKNQVDAETVLGQLSDAGYPIVSDLDEAQIILVNTCGFIQDAKEESIQAILDAAAYKGNGECRYLVALGCLSQRYGEELMRDIPELDAAFGVGQVPRIAAYIEALTAVNKRITETGGRDDPIAPYSRRILSTSPGSAYLKIGEGCDNRCSYCAIPLIRGPFRSREIGDILIEAESLVREGVREINLIAQDITRYGEDRGEPGQIVPLVKKIAAIPGLKWLRLLYAHPQRISDELIDTISKTETIVPYMDIPVQHADSDILRNMGRHTAPEALLRLIEKIRKMIPDMILRTSLIAGFPGETEEAFQRLLDFLNIAAFDRAGVFVYSQEEDTPAASFPDQIDEDVKQHRYHELMLCQQRITRRRANKRIGTCCEVLIEGRQDRGTYWGRSYAEAPDVDGKVYVFSDKPLKPGDFVRVRIAQAYEHDLAGDRI